MDGCLRTFGPSNVRRLEGDQGVGTGSGCWGLFVSNAHCPSLPSAFSGCVATQVAKRGQEATKGTGAMGQWGRAVRLVSLDTAE